MKYSGHAWALDNVYLGDGCPWMCSGHGYCTENKCMYVLFLINKILHLRDFFNVKIIKRGDKKLRLQE